MYTLYVSAAQPISRQTSKVNPRAGIAEGPSAYNRQQNVQCNCGPTTVIPEGKTRKQRNTPFNNLGCPEALVF